MHVLMDWEDKFSTIVRETELNLAKAKKNLSSKAHSSLSGSCQEALKFPTKIFPTLASGSSFLQTRTTKFDVKGGNLNTSIDNMSASSIQVLHMQDQIDSQNRTIEKLNHLVKSLDGERDYYKEQITLLKGEVDILTKTMTHSQPSTLASELKISNIKRELMLEMDKVKSLVDRFEKNSTRRTPAPSPSPRYDPEFWNIKENLTSSLEQVRLELSQMKGRIDRMEGQIAIDNLNRSKVDESFHKSLYSPNDSILTRRLYTPTTKIPPSVTESDLQHLRMAISSVNAKIDNIDKKSQMESKIFEEGNIRPSTLSSPRRNQFLSSLSRPFDSIIPMDDLHSLSDPSDLSLLSDDDDDDNDYDNSDNDDLDDLLGLNLDDKKKTFSSRLKGSHSKKGRVGFDLDDLDLSDIEELDGVEFDADSLDLDH